MNCSECVNYATLPNEQPCNECLLMDRLTFAKFAPIIKAENVTMGPVRIVGGGDNNE